MDVNFFDVCPVDVIFFSLLKTNTSVCCITFNFSRWIFQSRRKNREPKEENVTLGPAVRDGEHVFGVAHIFASFNDTFIVSDKLCLNLNFFFFFVFQF